MIRRLASLLLALLCLALLFLPGAVALTPLPKYPPVPDLLRVTMKEKRARQENGSILSVFYPDTANADVTKELNAVISGYIGRIAPALPSGGKTPEESKLDIRCVYSLTGDSWMSFTILARTVYHRGTVAEEATCRTYDMRTGRRILMTDLFPGGSPAWALIGEAVRSQLSDYFPDDMADAPAAEALCSRETLENADFCLGAVRMDLVYPASLLYPGRTTLMRVRVYYRDLKGMMAPEAAAQTDNSRYPMIALTFDDGPGYAGTVDLLDDLQAYGAKATFFLIGDQMDKNRDVVQRLHDEGHTVAYHSWDHGDPRKQAAGDIFEDRAAFDALLSSITGTAAPYMRAPGGRYHEFVASGIGLPLIQWSWSGGDIYTDDYRTIAQNVLGNARHGDIVLLHDVKSGTVQAMERLLYHLRRKGFLCVSVEDLFYQNGMEMMPGTVYLDANGNIETDGL